MPWKAVRQFSRLQARWACCGLSTRPAASAAASPALQHRVYPPFLPPCRPTAASACSASTPRAICVPRVRAPFLGCRPGKGLGRDGPGSEQRRWWGNEGRREVHSPGRAVQAACRRNRLPTCCTCRQLPSFMAAWPAPQPRAHRTPCQIGRAAQPRHQASQACGELRTLHPGPPACYPHPHPPPRPPPPPRTHTHTHHLSTPPHPFCPASWTCVPQCARSPARA